MKVFDSLEKVFIDPEFSDSLLTIGNFDGVHLGHQKFLTEVKKASINHKLKFIVLTFIPHPLIVLQAKSSFLINSYGERRSILKTCGADAVVELNFTRDFSSLSPEVFLKNFIFSQKQIKKIFLGYDFQFGANKTGDHELFKKMANEFHVDLFIQNEFKINEEIISSSAIRDYISTGRLEKANELLGRPFYLSGFIVRGQGRGKQIGFPTANLGIEKDYIYPQKGVYVSQIDIKGMRYHSLTNVGHNPTFNEGSDVTIETHILDFNQDIYGDTVKVHFLKKLREEKKFLSVNELIRQIELDIMSAEKFFK